MPKKLAASAAALLLVALAVPAFACGGKKDASASNASAAMSSGGSCSSEKSAATAWAGAWLKRSPEGRVVVAEVAAKSPAQRAGLKSGDVVLAVNGYDLAAKSGSSCSSHSNASASMACKVGNAVTYKVQRGSATKSVKVTLEKMPADAANRLAQSGASFEPTLAAAVIPTAN